MGLSCLCRCRGRAATVTGYYLKKPAIPGFSSSLLHLLHPMNLLASDQLYALIFTLFFSPSSASVSTPNSGLHFFSLYGRSCIHAVSHPSLTHVSNRCQSSLYHHSTIPRPLITTSRWHHPPVSLHASSHKTSELSPKDILITGLCESPEQGRSWR